jgi:hypothetical protein
VVGDTWRFVNKSGGPDRRFNFNKRLPICLYGEMDIKSSSGLNAKLYFSQPAAGDRFLRVFEALHQTMPSHLDSKPIALHKESNRWPAIISGCVFLLLGAALTSSGLPRFMNLLTAVQGTNWGASAELQSARMAQPHFSTGQIGSATTTKVNGTVAASAQEEEPKPRPIPPAVPLPKDATRIQGRLIELGYLQGPADGIWGPRSKQALLAFKISNGLAPDDKFDTTVSKQIVSANNVRGPLSDK